MNRACPGCGASLPASGLPVQPFSGASPECWNAYVDLLRWLAQRPGRDGLRQNAVAAYSAQHPGGDDPRERQRLGLHLVGLYLALEADSPAVLRPAQYGRLAARDFDWPLLQAPSAPGLPTVRELLDCGEEQRPRRVEAWAGQVWRSWSPYHPTVRHWWKTLGA